MTPSAPNSTRGGKTPFVGEVIAERLIELAKDGERDPQRMADAMGHQKPLN